MAQPPQLDFDAFVARRKGERVANLDVGREYTYVLDKQTRAAFANARPVEMAVSSAVRVFKEVERGRLLGSAVKVGDRQFPRIQAIAKKAAGVLDIPTPTVYIVNSPVLNAATYGTEDESFIMVHSALVDHYSDEELLTVIGHECGHIHNSHVVYLTTLYLLTQAGGLMLSRVLGPLTQIALEPIIMALRAWSRRAEITCDRAGMLCSGDTVISQRALTKLVLGSHKLYDEFNLDAFLEQYEEGKDGIGRWMEAFATHPYLPKRVLAMRVFQESAVYRRSARLGDGGLEMKEVDDRVKAILKDNA